MDLPLMPSILTGLLAVLAVFLFWLLDPVFKMFSVFIQALDLGHYGWNADGVEAFEVAEVIVKPVDHFVNGHQDHALVERLPLLEFVDVLISALEDEVDVLPEPHAYQPAMMPFEKSCRNCLNWRACWCLASSALPASMCMISS